VRLIWTPASETDRINIFTHIAADNPSAAFELEQLIEERADQLLDFPEMGRPGLLPDTRELTVHPNHRLVYELVGDDVQILTVVHARRDWREG
jgi:toxin ParE1/3/4